MLGFTTIPTPLWALVIGLCALHAARSMPMSLLLLATGLAACLLIAAPKLLSGSERSARGLDAVENELQALEKLVLRGGWSR